ncbi:hypothetical protein XELAEV_18018672mg [Xenopus laevis]|uniref:GIY-YIG domain-containing protein n=1 Tax=Xenopus laevis TaxID=8355 RepID=A0A974DG31_XENLA|nr:hypothetical protein XELAEV_18018672mg [Xenopus laevis]
MQRKGLSYSAVSSGRGDESVCSAPLRLLSAAVHAGGMMASPAMDSRAPGRAESPFPSLTSLTLGSVEQHPTKGNNIQLKDYATCNTEGAIYMLKCPCGQVYVGQTARQIKARIKEHSGNIKNLKSNTYTDTPVSPFLSA